MPYAAYGRHRPPYPPRARAGGRPGAGRLGRGRRRSRPPGDRYFRAGGTFADRDGSDLTLIEREALTAVEREHGIVLEPGVHRRNVTTEGVALNDLIGERFRVGGAVCLGTEFCELCSYLERHLAERGLREALVRRGGLRCRVVDGGRIGRGDRIRRSSTGAAGSEG